MHLKLIYFSYASDVSEDENNYAEQLFSMLQNDGFTVIRDKTERDYGGLISEFIKETSKGDLVIVIISDAYLRSPDCMYELYEIARQNRFEAHDFAHRILPILLEEINLDDIDIQEKYFDYWEAEKAKQGEFVQKRLQRGNLTQAQSDRFGRVQNVEQNLGNLIGWLADIYSSTLKLLGEDDFEVIKEAVKKRLGRQN